jgi:hypothetical protein
VSDSETQGSGPFRPLTFKDKAKIRTRINLLDFLKNASKQDPSKVRNQKVFKEKKSRPTFSSDFKISFLKKNRNSLPGDDRKSR